MTPADLTSHRVSAVVSSLWSAAAWRATRNGLAALLLATVTIVLLGGLGVLWGAALYSLLNWPVGGWSHAALYLAMVIAGPVLALWAVQGLTALQRSRLRAVARVDIPVSSRAAERKPWPVGPWLAGATWRQLGFNVLSVGTGAVAGLLAACWLAPAAAIGYLAAGHPSAAGGTAACAAAIVLLFAAPRLAKQVARVDEGMARALLGPSQSEELALRLESLTRSRAEIIAATDAERRRIERDLHDGAQQRLVSLAMNLGMAKARFADAPEPVRRAIADAHEEAILALSEVREFIRGLYPAILSDRGLDAALSGLAARAPLPVRLHVDVAQPAAPSVEAVAYFIVSEALTNVSKHAHATQAEVTVTRAGDKLRIVVTDNGSGGAAPTGGDDEGGGTGFEGGGTGPEGGGTGPEGGGTGLWGLAQRVASVDGTLTIDSPPGGPTVIAAELPCES